MNDPYKPGWSGGRLLSQMNPDTEEFVREERESAERRNEDQSIFEPDERIDIIAPIIEHMESRHPERVIARAILAALPKDQLCVHCHGQGNKGELKDREFHCDMGATCPACKGKGFIEPDTNFALYDQAYDEALRYKQALEKIVLWDNNEKPHTNLPLLDCADLARKVLKR